MTERTIEISFQEEFYKQVADKWAEVSEDIIREAKENGANYLAIAHSFSASLDDVTHDYKIFKKFRPLATIELPSTEELEEFANGDEIEFFEFNESKPTKNEKK